MTCAKRDRGELHPDLIEQSRLRELSGEVTASHYPYILVSCGYCYALEDVRGVALHEAHVSTFRYLQVAVFSGPDGIRRGRCTHAE